MSSIVLRFFLLFLLGTNVALSFGLNLQPAGLKKQITRPLQQPSVYRLDLALSGGAQYEDEGEAYNELRDDTNQAGLLREAAMVGLVTAAMGFVYGKVLGSTVSSVWTSLPSLLSKHGISLNALYIICVCTIGGLITGICSAILPSSFNVADFVQNVPSSKPFPPLLSSLVPLLLLSLLTSTFGFSVGPEAPMVAAGGLVGACMAKPPKSTTNSSISGSNSSNTRHRHKQETLAYAGAAGALTAFMGIPLAGSIFALELTHASAGFVSGAKQALSPSVVASAVALLLIRGILEPTAHVGGHFSYGVVWSLGGRTAMAAAIGAGIAGGAVGNIFVAMVGAFKSILWTKQAPNTKQAVRARARAPLDNMSSNENKEKGTNGVAWKREIVIKTMVGFMVGIIGAYYPQTLFWGEGSLQPMIDGQKTAFAATKHGLPAMLTRSALVQVHPQLPFQNAGQAAQVAFAKLVAIALACAGKFPGGIIFPLFFAAAPLAHAIGASLMSILPTNVLPVLVMCLMASTQAAVTRTPLATILILTLSASASTELSVMLPAVILSSYLGVWTSQLLSKASYFQYAQK